MRLLLAEDDPELSARLKNFLGRNGFAVDIAGNGVDAEFDGQETQYDVIVLDLGLPQRPGLEVLANWRNAQMQAPVLILTARDSWQEKVQGLRQGADDYLTKPFQVEEIGVVVHRTADVEEEQQLDQVEKGQAGKPLAVVADLGPIDVQDQPHLIDVGGGVPTHGLLVEGGSRLLLPRRVADPGSEIPHQEDDGVTQLLEAPQLLQHDRVTEV